MHSSGSAWLWMWPVHVSHLTVLSMALTCLTHPQPVRHRGPEQFDLRMKSGVWEVLSTLLHLPPSHALPLQSSSESSWEGMGRAVRQLQAEATWEGSHSYKEMTWPLGEIQNADSWNPWEVVQNARRRACQVGTSFRDNLWQAAFLLTKAETAPLPLPPLGSLCWDPAGIPSPPGGASRRGPRS